MPDPYQHIAELESRIDVLSRTAEGCRKIMAAARMAIAGGSLTLLTLVLEVLPRDSFLLLFGIIAVLGGIVAFGSNRSTLEQVMNAIRSLEVRRIQLIDSLHLEVVEPDLDRRV